MFVALICTTFVLYFTISHGIACNYNLKKNKLNCRIYNKNIETHRPTQKKFVKTNVRHVSVGINCYTTVQWTFFPYSCGPFYPVSVNGRAIAWTFFQSGPIYRGPFFQPWTFFPWPFFPLPFYRIPMNQIRSTS